MTELTIEYFEDLSDTGNTCPPDQAFQPDGMKEYFRVVKHNPATSECFFSHRRKNPDKEYPDECIAKGLNI